jgi:uncharacterized repeat protein (TIGR01451 family)
VITVTFNRTVTGTPTIAIDTSGVDLSSTSLKSSSDGKVWTLSYQPEENIRPGTTVVITAKFDKSFTGPPSISINTSGPDVGPVVMTSSSDGLVWTYTYVVPAGSEGTATVKVTGPSSASASQKFDIKNGSFSIAGDTADLSVGVTASVDKIVRRGQLTYTITVVNRGPKTATGVKLVNEVPGGVSIDAVNPASLNCSVASGTVTCDIGTLASGAGVVALVDVTVDADADGTLVNSSRVSGSPTDSNNTNNVDTAETQVIVGVLSYVVSIANGDLNDTGITLTDSPDPVFLGNDLTYDLDVSNSESQTVTDVNLIVSLPSAVNFASAVVELNFGGGTAQRRLSEESGTAPKVASLMAAVSVAKVGECTEGSGTVICALGELHPGQVARVTILVEPIAPGILNNQAKLVQEGQDPETTGKIADESTTVMLMSDLNILLQDVSTSAASGDQVTFGYLITNEGPSDATGILLSEILPAGLQLVPPAADPSSCTVLGGELTCRIGSLASGESRSMSLTLVIGTSVTGDLVNIAKVAGEQADFESENNSISSTLSITPLADLSLTRTDCLGSKSDNPEHNDNEIISIFTVTNNGPSAATNVVLTNVLSVDVILISVSGDQASCRVAGGTVLCDLSDLANGETATFTIVLAPVEGGLISSGVRVQSDQSDPREIGPWEFFLDLSDARREIAPSNAKFKPVIAKDSNFLIGGILLGLGLTTLVSLLGRNFVIGGKREPGSGG